MTKSVMEPEKYLTGNVFREGEENYDSARKLWNGMIDNKPYLIVQCRTAEDVLRAVDFAHQKKLQISVRAGGHGVAGHAIINNGLVIDLSLMKGICIDQEKRSVKAEAGLLGAELDCKTQETGLAVPMGTVSHTGIAGLTLGGGYGWLSRKFGLSCDNLLSVNLVTPNGEFLYVDNHHYPDLFWAIKGGSGNFGIVTSFEYSLYKVGPEIFGGLLIYPFEKARDVLELYREFTNKSSDDFTIYVYFFHEGDKLVCCLSFFYAGELEQGAKAIEEFRKLEPIADSVGMIPYTTMQQLIDHHAPHGRQYYWRANYLDKSGLTSEAIQLILEKTRNITSKKSLISIEQIGGKINSLSKEATAFFHRDAGYNFLICSGWDDKEGMQRHISYANEFWTAMSPYFLPGSYQNYGGEARANPRIIYGDNYQKLFEIKQKYDPENTLVGNYAFSKK